MALPTGGAWPPPLTQTVLDRMTVWDAWYTGDPDRLSSTYGGTTAPANRPSQYRGGLVGTVARWFWGRPTPDGEQRSKLHVPLASDICQTSADLLFSEPPVATVDDERTQKRLDELLDEGVHATLLEAAEVCAALGGVYLRPAWDTDLADRPWLSVVHADAAVPEFRWGMLSAVTFWEELESDGSTVIRHLERHETGVILHGLYQGTREELGRMIPLTEHEATRPYAAVVNADGAIPTGLDGLAAQYVPNMRPNRRWRSVRGAHQLGRSDLDGIEPLLDALDETYSSWMRDVQLGKARLVVPSSYLESNGPGQGASFDPDRSLYEGVNALPRPGESAAITPVQFAIRVTEHRDTANDLVEQILRTAGYSAQTFGRTGEAAVTATEVVARNHRSYMTRGRKIVYWNPLAAAYETLLAIDATVFRSGARPSRPNLEWPDAVTEDPATLANTADTLRRAEAASTETLVRMVHPDWDDTAVQAEVERVQGETGRALPSPGQDGLIP